ncbi:splicing factor 3B subunit 4 [Abrus precatorius]|uniref:Splicing factor 3B subunit 4 n=1 Tax=Abrus precatorius TaxID=3816 RepID=A0A8B8MG38_ABRPR|nr:splicing factor 3B subunit 4 [Abrus precatorius]XP_027366155.1 splicing factor 3B subunit 4 [Abrus precatorius]
MTTRIAPGVGANLLGQHSAERNQDATAYVGNLDPQITEELLWELFVQAGPVVNVYVPKDRVSNQHQGYGFVEFRSEEDADYAIKVLNMIKLYGKPIRVNKASQDKKSLDVGANLFIGNLDPDVDEKLLYDTFSAFGVIVTNPKIMRDPETGNSRGFGFISYDSFEASDSAIEAMNGQYLCNRQITVSYAYKKDTKGERHGTPAERVLAASNPSAQKSRPHTLFASGPPTLPGAQANGSIAAPVPPRPFANGVAPAAIPALRLPPPQAAAFQPMSVPGQPAWHQQQPGQTIMPPVMPPPQVQQFRPPHSGMQMPLPPQAVPAPPRPLPPPAVMASQPPPVWRPQPPPPPQQQGGRPLVYPQSSMPPPPPPSNSAMPPP